AYYEYAAAEPFPARILEVREGGPGEAVVILDRTIFYPEGGGQSADRGRINGAALADVREKDGEIQHIVPAADASGLSPGPAELRLDAGRRRDFTVLHTAQHLLSGTILRLTGAYTVSMHLGDELCTIDVDIPELTGDTLIAVEDAVADAIEADSPVIIHLCPPERVTDFPLRKTPPQGEDVIRVVEIRGHDFSPCCGTHLRSTGQIGMLRILGAEKYKGMTRLSFIAGRRVLRDSRLLRQNGEFISRALKIPVGETGAGVLALLEKTNRLEGDLKKTLEELARFKAEALLRETPEARSAGAGTPDEGGIFTALLSDADMDEALRIGRAAQKLTRAVLVLGAEREGKFAAFCGVKGVDIRPLITDAMEARGGRGGGGPSFFQGLFPSGDALRAFLANLKA
ncbi:MAG: alanyl-tRNA editing protein, partial [Spirochaetaceae bacterium]|nr:alanyl-tRNA editing protein [Spirochaetaceae bacterium]